MSRTILLTEFYPPEHGGIQRSVEVALRILGPDVTVVAPPHPRAAAYDQSQPYRVERRSLFSGRGWPSWWWLVAWLRRQQPHLVVYGHFSAATLAAMFAGVPYAILVHGRDLLVEERRRPIAWLISRVLKRAVWVGVNSTFTADQVQAHGVAQARIIRTHPTVDDQRVRPRTHVPGHRLISVCRLVERKNVQTVIAAVAQLRKTFPDIQYDVIGDGPERPSLAEQIHNLDLENTVTLHGNVNEAAKWNLLYRADVGVMLPEVREEGSDVEGLGIFYLEAAAAGLTLVASATGGVTDIVRHGTTGLIADPADSASVASAIEQALQDVNLGPAAQTLVQREFTTPVRNRRLEAITRRHRMQNPPLVSVIIPAYQAAKTIPTTLAALEKQSWPRIEMIVVNDGSTDDLEKSIAPWRGRLTYIIQAQQGAPVARNSGAAKAHGDFFLFCDADMYLEPDMITDMVVTLMTHPEASYAYSNFRFGPKGFHLFEYDAERLTQQNYIHTSSLIRREAFPGFDPELKKFQDWDVWLTLKARGHSGIWIPRELFRVQQRAGGYSTWLPSFLYKLPGIGQGRGSKIIRRYRQAESIIRQKHGLD